MIPRVGIRHMLKAQQTCPDFLSFLKKNVEGVSVAFDVLVMRESYPVIPFI